MTRLTQLGGGMALAWAVALLGACGGQVSLGESNRPGSTSAQALVGGSCTPSEELQATFAGADDAEVSVQTLNDSCASGEVCMSNHFRGRTTCPYGGAPGFCRVPGTGAPVSAGVLPQCADRRPEEAVYCSCRCANPAGRTDDGASYCSCPSWAECTQLITPVGVASADSFAGAYCMKKGTAYDPLQSCKVQCDATSASCP